MGDLPRIAGVALCSCFVEKSMRLYPLLKFMLVLLIFASISPVHRVTAQESARSELINLINGLRASYGLAPYTVDPGLMAMAQEHSAYQASIHTSTHQHSDGSDPPDLGVVENVAGGDIGFMDPQIAVYQIWVDVVHMKTMTGYEAGSMGVGVADDGETVYYTLEVRPLGSAATASNPSGTESTQNPSTPIPLVPLATMTPNSDGATFHVVGYGQTLWAIALAYGVRIEQIRAWNNIPEDSSDIYAGQRLLVHLPGLASLTPTSNPGTVQKDSATVLALLNLVEKTSTPSPTALPASPTAPALYPSVETQEGIPSVTDSSSIVSGSPGLLIAGVSILVGFLLFFILLITKKPA